MVFSNISDIYNGHSCVDSSALNKFIYMSKSEKNSTCSNRKLNIRMLDLEANTLPLVIKARFYHKGLSLQSIFASSFQACMILKIYSSKESRTIDNCSGYANILIVTHKVPPIICSRRQI